MTSGPVACVAQAQGIALNGRGKRTLQALRSQLPCKVRSGIDECAVLADLEVNMRTGGPSGRAAESDHLTLLDHLPRGDEQLVEVAVQREEPVAVGDDDVVAVADQLTLLVSTRGCQDHPAGSSCANRRVQRRGDVEPRMEVWIEHALVRHRWLERVLRRTEWLRHDAAHGRV